MVEKEPMLNSLAMRMRGKSYIRSETADKALPTSMTVRGKSYVGLPLSGQSDAHKGGHLSRRGAGYTGLKLAQQTPSVRGPHMKIRGAGYTGLKLAQQAASAKGPQMKARDRKYSGKPSTLHPYATNSEFRLKIGKYSLKCAKVSNISVALETEEVPEGGNNLFPNVFLGARKKADTLVVERALVNDEVMSAFRVGVHVVECTLTILRNGEVYKEFGFDEGVITKFELTNLDAMGREIMIHKLEIAHSGWYTW